MIDRLFLTVCSHHDTANLQATDWRRLHNPTSSLSSDLKWDDKASQFSMEPSTFLKMLQHHCS